MDHQSINIKYLRSGKQFLKNSDNDIDINYSKYLRLERFYNLGLNRSNQKNITTLKTPTAPITKSPPTNIKDSPIVNRPPLNLIEKIADYKKCKEHFNRRRSQKK